MTRRREHLREGFTTGTAAAAAAKAAVLSLLGLAVAEQLDTPLPTGARLAVPVERAAPEAGDALAVRALVIKDGGDDPDATHMAAIEAVARLAPDRPGVRIEGGRGVGRVTLPGLPVAVGEAAINPAPRAQISAAVQEALDAAGFAGGADIRIDVPDGEEIARHTMNARLGIVGGISILGTRGTVRPFSHDSWAAAVAQGLSVARALGHADIALATGGRSERFLRAALPRLPAHCFAQAADFFAFSCQEAARLGFARLHWGVFIGKLVKQAQGLSQTHAREAPLDFAFLAGRARAAGIPAPLAEEVGRANTARQALDLLRGQSALPRLARGLCVQAAQHAAAFAAAGGKPVLARCLLFDYDGSLLGDASAGELREEDYT